MKNNANAERRKNNQELLEDILLCDPITERGIERLKRLGLQDKISPRSFFEGENRLLVDPSNLEPTFTPEELGTSPMNSSYFDIWTLARRRSDIEKTQENAIDEHFDGKNGTQLHVLMGVVGNGKSINLQYRVFEKKNAIPFRSTADRSFLAFRSDMTPEAVLIDIERVNVHVDGGSKNGYKCPDSEKPEWLFCTKLLSTLTGYIDFLNRNYVKRLKAAVEIFSQKFYNEVLGITKAPKSISDVFISINMLISQKKSNREVFDTILAGMKSGEGGPSVSKETAMALEDTSFLLDTLAYLILCVTAAGVPENEKHIGYILIDNIEDYVKFFGNEASITNKTVREIYLSSRDAADRMSERKESLESDIEMPYTMAIRRTTRTLLDSYYDGNNNASIEKIADVTGRVNLHEIWYKKKAVLWDKYLTTKYSDSENDLVQFADKIIHKDVEGSGTSFLDMFAKLMSHSLRRTAHGASGAIRDIYELKTALLNKRLLISVNSKPCLSTQALHHGFCFDRPCWSAITAISS